MELRTLIGNLNPDITAAKPNQAMQRRWYFDEVLQGGL
jgi:hypothetical protein